MKRISVLLFLLSIWMAAAMLLVFDYTHIRLNVYQGKPLGLPNDYYEFSVFRSEASSTNEIKGLRGKIIELLDKEQAVLVFQGDQSFGLGLYDPIGYFRDVPLVSGEPLRFLDVDAGTDILLRERSYASQHLTVQGAYSSTVGLLHPVGTYGAQHPLDINPYDYILDFKLSTSLDGVYTLHSNNVSLYVGLRKLLIRNGYVFHYERTPGQRTFSATLRQLMQDKFLPGMLLGLLFIYINYFFFCLRALARLRRTAVIHFLVGATQRGFLSAVWRSAMPGFMLGSVLGLVAFVLLFVPELRPKTAWLYAAAFISHLLLSSGGLILAYYAKRFDKALEGGLP